jgi:hypothetical protein
MTMEPISTTPDLSANEKRSSRKETSCAGINIWLTPEAATPSLDGTTQEANQEMSMNPASQVSA